MSQEPMELYMTMRFAELTVRVQALERRLVVDRLINGVTILLLWIAVVRLAFK